MENSYNTSIKTKYESLKSFSIHSSSKENYGLIEKVTALGFQEIKNSPHTKLNIFQIHRDTVEFSLIKENQTLRQTLSHNNFIALIKLYSRISTPAPKVTGQYPSKKLLKTLSLSHSLINNISSLFIKDTNLYSFTQSLFTLSIFNKFRTIHLFVHEKGLSQSVHSNITRDEVVHQSQNVSDFSHLFLAIKKSKNKSFGQSSLKASNFHIIGTCLAIDLQLNNHNLIFVISKDDFIDQSQADIVNFNNVIPLLHTFYDLLLAQQLSSDKVNTLFEIFTSLVSEANPQESIITLDSQNPHNTHALIESSQESLLQMDTLVSDSHHKEKIELLGDLLNTLKHELSNPLFGMQLSTDLLLLEDLDEDQKTFVKGIESSIKHSQKILTSFSDIYNAEQDPTQLNVINLLNEVFVLTKSETRAISISIEKEENTVNYDIISNPTWLAQVFFNLIINSSQALKSSSTVGPKITIVLKSSENKLQILFKDNGPGISPTMTESIFTPFYTTKNSGTGLGLSITRKLMTKLNGTIQYIKSDIGAHFMIEINR